MLYSLGLSDRLTVDCDSRLTVHSIHCVGLLNPFTADRLKALNYAILV